MAAPDREVVRPCDLTIFAPPVGFDIPYIVTPNRGADPDLSGVLKSRDEDPRSPAGGTDHLRLCGDRFYDLVGILAAVIAVGAVREGSVEPECEHRKVRCRVKMNRSFMHDT